MSKRHNAVSEKRGKGKYILYIMRKFSKTALYNYISTWCVKRKGYWAQLKLNQT